MRILICDDDAIIINLLTEYLQVYFTQHELTVPTIVSYSREDDLLKDKEKGY